MVNRTNPKPTDDDDPRTNGRVYERDGRCLECGQATFLTDARYAPADCPNVGDIADYFVWCSNTACPRFAGEVVGDMECPPAWANHERD